MNENCKFTQCLSTSAIIITQCRYIYDCIMLELANMHSNDTPQNSV